MRTRPGSISYRQPISPRLRLTERHPLLRRNHRSCASLCASFRCAAEVILASTSIRSPKKRLPPRCPIQLRDRPRESSDWWSCLPSGSESWTAALRHWQKLDKEEMDWSQMRVFETGTAAVAVSCSRKARHMQPRHWSSIWVYCDLAARSLRLGRAKQSRRTKRETISIRNGELHGRSVVAVASRDR